MKTATLSNDHLFSLSALSSAQAAILKAILFFVGFTTGQLVKSEIHYSLELGSTTQSLNDVRIPGNTGTKIDLTEFSKGPFTNYRLYVGYRWGRNELRGLYAPSSINLSGNLKEPTTFQDSIFQPGTPTEAFYMFNSYRLTYSYALEKSSEWDLRFGFTGKIRDAEIRLTQGVNRESKNNVGFVPLLNFQALRPLGDQYSFYFDLDALGAPQGRAIDLGAFFERKIGASDMKAFAGYRTVEGGADNESVYNFAWFHTLTIGLKGRF